MQHSPIEQKIKNCIINAHPPGIRKANIPKLIRYAKVLSIIVHYEIGKRPSY
jgi:hypothetical protein